MGHPPLDPPPTKASVAAADAKKAPWLLPQNQVEATHTPRQDKVENGYGLPTTLYSITHLGHADFSTAATKGRVQEKACFVNKRFHNPSRKDLHMQVAYPETIAKLQPLQGDLSRAVTPPQLKEMDPTKRKTRGEERQVPYEETNPADTRMRYGLTLKTKDDRERNKREMNRCQIDFSSEPHFSPRGRPTSAPWGTDGNLDAARDPPAQRPAPFYDGDDTSMRLRAT